MAELHVTYSWTSARRGLSNNVSHRALGYIVLSLYRLCTLSCTFFMHVCCVNSIKYEYEYEYSPTADCTPVCHLRPPSWKSIFGNNSSTDCPISAKFCVRKQNDMSTKATWQKLQILKTQDGGRPPFWKLLNRHISVKKRPILMKFSTLHQMLNPITDSEILYEKAEPHVDEDYITKTANF